MLYRGKPSNRVGLNALLLGVRSAKRRQTPRPKSPTNPLVPARLTPSRDAAQMNNGQAAPGLAVLAELRLRTIWLVGLQTHWWPARGPSPRPVLAPDWNISSPPLGMVRFPREEQCCRPKCLQRAPFCRRAG